MIALFISANINDSVMRVTAVLAGTLMILIRGLSGTFADRLGIRCQLIVESKTKRNDYWKEMLKTVSGIGPIAYEWSRHSVTVLDHKLSVILYREQLRSQRT